MLTLVSLASIVLVASVAFAQTGTPTQENQNKARGEWRGHGKGGRHGGFGRGGERGIGGFGGGAMFRQLNLTEDQKTRMKQIHEGFGERTRSLRQQLRTKQQELRQSTDGGTFNEALVTQKLTEEAGLKAKLMGEQFKLRQEMLTVLTAEQRTQMEQLREQFKTNRGQFKSRRGAKPASGETQNQ